MINRLVVMYINIYYICIENVKNAFTLQHTHTLTLHIHKCKWGGRAGAHPNGVNETVKIKPNNILYTYSPSVVGGYPRRTR